MNIHSLFILKTSGVCLYSRNFTDEFEKLDVHLVTPFFSAIFSFSKKVIHKKLEELEMSGLRFTFKVIDEFIFTILADSSVSILFTSTRLSRIVDAFLKEYYQSDKLKDFTEIENPDFDKVIDSIIAGEEINPEIYTKIIEHFKNLMIQDEISGAAVLSTNGSIIYNTLPSDILLGSLKELEIRFMSGALDVPELFYSLENGEKVFSKIISEDISGLNFFIVLLFRSSIPLGVAEVNLFKITNQIKKLISSENK